VTSLSAASMSLLTDLCCSDTASSADLALYGRQ
jgi:hypothetical protein